ncbi:arabinofuranosyltransferase [Spirillospora sp. NPDC052269]
MPSEPTAVEAAPTTPSGTTEPTTPPDTTEPTASSGTTEPTASSDAAVVRQRRVPGPAAVAAAVWVVGLPLALWLPSRLDVDPFVQRSADLPLAMLFGGTLVLAVVGMRWRRDWLFGAAAGGYAVYAALVARCALSGTPFGYGDFFSAGGRVSVMGDAGRIAAMATRYTVRWKSSDGIVGTVPSEYPPLYPYVIGKASWLLDVPAWKLVGAAQAVTLSLALLVGFVLWARVVPAGAALFIGPLWLATTAEPHKAYEYLTLSLLIPLVLNTIARPPRGRLHWTWAGLGFSVLFLTYYGYAVFVALGVLAIGWQAWRTEGARREYLLYLGRVVAVTAVLTSWFLLPYLWAMVTGGQQVGDMYSSERVSTRPLGFTGNSMLGPLQLVGLLALLWYARTRRWAWSLLALVCGAYAYQAVSMIRWVTTAHNGLLYYVRTPVAACLIAGAVLGLREAVPALAERRGRLLSASAPVLVAALTFIFAGYGFWNANMPVNQWTARLSYGAEPDYTTTRLSNWDAARSHALYLPDGSRPKHAADVAALMPVMKGDGQIRYLPINAIKEAVRKVRPHDRTPSVLTYDEQLFVFLPWNGYIGVDRVASYGPARWPVRFAELQNLSHVQDPSAFAASSARTKFGAIDVFVLQKDGAGLVWRGIQAPPPYDLRFSYAQFRDFATVDVGNDTVVAVRRP